jgi:hypothetical protein
MKQIGFTTTLYFDIPFDVAPIDHIEHLNNLLHIQKELLLLQLVDINTEGKWEAI